MFKVIDNITGETILFDNKYEAECEAERRVNLHLKGYNIRHNHIQGCNAIMIYNPKNKTYEITVEGR